MNIKNLVLSFLVLAVFNGCYTKLGSIEQPGEQLKNSDTLVDTAGSRAQVDTVIYKEKEICIWERDFTGMPRLRCFPSYYNRDWYFYSSSPWWFRNSSDWYDYKRCPRYYYYDPYCGCCKYSRVYPYNHHRGGIGGANHGSDVSNGIPNRSRSVGNVGSSGLHQGGTTLPKSSQNNTNTTDGNTSNNSGGPKRNRDVGQMGGSRVIQTNQVEGGMQKKVETVQEPRKPVVVEQPIRPLRTDSSVVAPRTMPKRNSRW
ncbi:MAG TPA: hypothetical protein VHP36_00070 [Chitinispirillaceae bacterium]|nr:hypothetical protein [Chitinispirillaceae bacterium]